MINRKHVFVFSVFVVFCSGTLAKDSELARCQKLQKEIEKYTELRRAGGSGSQMDAWKRARREKEKALRNASCRDYSWELQQD